MNKKEKEFVNYVKSECKKYGVKCDLRKTKYVKLSGNIKCSGYFDEDGLSLVCSMNRPMMIILILEGQIFFRTKKCYSPLAK